MSLHLHLTAAQGPDECHLAVAGLVAALVREAADAGLAAHVLSVEESAHGLRSAIVAFDGAAAETFTASWSGTVRWTCPSPLRPGLGRKNWFVAVAPVTMPVLGTPGFRDRDLVWETFRASGKGGQHVNTTDSAVRLRHAPSGLVVECRGDRSQHRNRGAALAKLAVALAAREDAAHTAAHAARRTRDVKIADRGAAALRAYSGLRFERIR